MNSPFILRDPIQIVKLDIVGETLSTVVADVNRSKRIDQAELRRKQSVEADNQTLLNKRKELENLWANKPKTEAPKLAYTVKFPDEKELAVRPLPVQKVVGAPLPSHQDFVDWLCTQAAKEVRKLPGGKFLSQETLHDLCVLGVNAGLSSVPALKKYVKDHIRMPRFSSKSSKQVVAKAPKQQAIVRATPAMRSMSVSAPVAIGRRVASRNKPRFTNRNGNVTISHTEFIGNLYSSSSTLSYYVRNFVLNPGNVGTFPWLSTFASNFDKYKFHKVVMHIVSNQATSTAGRIGVGVDYDSTDPLPGDRGEFFSLTHHQETSPWDSIVMNVPIKPEEKFINSHTVSDSKLIDCGQIIIMSDQIVATTVNLADVIIEYVVELIQPQQAIFNTEIITGVHPTSFLDLTFVGPVIGRPRSTTSSTVLEFDVPVGYYVFSVNVYDAAAGSPVVTPTIHQSTGTMQVASTTTVSNAVGKFKAVGPESVIKLTYSGVAVISLERFNITISRVSATVFNTIDFEVAITTY